MGFFKKIGKSINHSTNVVGKKLSSTPHILGKKASGSLNKVGKKASQFGRDFSDDLSELNRTTQKLKGLSILAGPYAPAVEAGIESLDAATAGVSEIRRNANKLKTTR